MITQYNERQVQRAEEPTLKAKKRSNREYNTSNALSIQNTEVASSNRDKLVYERTPSQGSQRVHSKQIEEQ